MQQTCPQLVRVQVFGGGWGVGCGGGGFTKDVLKGVARCITRGPLYIQSAKRISRHKVHSE